MIVEELENNQEENRKLRDQIADFNNEVIEKNSHISLQNEELSTQRERIIQLEQELATLTASLAASNIVRIYWFSFLKTREYTFCLMFCSCKYVSVICLIIYSGASLIQKITYLDTCLGTNSLS